MKVTATSPIQKVGIPRMKAPIGTTLSQWLPRRHPTNMPMRIPSTQAMIVEKPTNMRSREGSER